MKSRQGGAHEDSGRPLGPVLDFMRLLWALDHGLQSTSKRMESALGVTGPQRLVIRIVGQVPHITAGALAEVLHIHPSTLTGVLKRLVAGGLIARKADPDDARRARFVLTAKGAGLNKRRSGTVEEAVRRTLEHLPEAKLRVFQEVLARLTAEVSDR